MSRKSLLAFIALAIVFASGYYLTQNSAKTDGSHDYRFEIVEGERIAVDNGNIYVFKFIGKEKSKIPCIKMINGWNLTLDRNLWVANVLKNFNGNIYAAGVDVVKIKNRKIDWAKDLVVKRVSYKGTREKPVPVYYEDLLNVFDIESDGRYLYLNVRDGIVKTDRDLNVLWAVSLHRLNDDIAVSDGIYATRWNYVIKLNKEGELEWAVSLKSDEKIKIKIPEEKIRAAEVQGKKIPEFYEEEKYTIELFTVYADVYVYVAGIIREHLPFYEKDYPFLAKFNSKGELLWAKIINATYIYPGSYYLRGKIIKDGNNFIAWINRNILFVFDENGRVLNFYTLKEIANDIDISNSVIYLAYQQDPAKSVEIEKKEASAVPINIKAVRMQLQMKYFECYSKNWTKGEMLIPIG